MKLSELVSFDREHYFQGAVQADWFYHEDKCQAVASSYVFHGKRYYGVSDKDVVSKGHRLLDTASFVENLADKLYSPENSQYLLMTISGYGTGKSHLAVSLGGLFSGEPELQSEILENIKTADKDVASKVEKINKKKNFVLVLNGMQNFNLDAQILKQTKEILCKEGIDPEILRPLTKSYEIARHFVEKNFSVETFDKLAKAHGFTEVGESLKSRLLSELESNKEP